MSAIDRLTSLLARPAVLVAGGPLGRWAAAVELTTGRTPTRAERRAAVASWLRTRLETATLPWWPRSRLAAAVRLPADDLERLHRAAAETGLVVVLAHLANPDLAGAWAATQGLDVSSVAEHLPDGGFAAHRRFRRRLGIEVVAHDDPAALRALRRALGQGRVVCLLSDRDLTGTGLDVAWGHGRTTVPGGAAVLARASGATLLVATARYDGPDMVLALSQPVAHRSGRDGLARMTAEVAAHLVAGVDRSPTDWHVFVPFGSSREASS